MDAAIQPGAPCHDHSKGSIAIDCAFPGPDPAIVDVVSSPISEQCAYDPSNVNPAWRFGSCTLGVPASRILGPLDLFTSAKHNWNLQSYTGDPIPGLSIAGSYRGSPRTLAMGARSVVSGSRSGKAQVHLTGRVRRAGGGSLRGARVVVRRMLALPAAAARSCTAP